MHTVEPKLREAGYEVLFVSTDRPELLHSSLKDPSVSIDCTLLSDPTLQAAQAFHIAFHVDDKNYAKQPISLLEVQFNEKHCDAWSLPVKMLPVLQPKLLLPLKVLVHIVQIQPLERLCPQTAGN